MKSESQIRERLEEAKKETYRSPRSDIVEDPTRLEEVHALEWVLDDE